MPIGSENSRLSRRATPQCVTSPSAGRRPCQPIFCRATLRTTDRLYRRMRIGAAQRKLSRKNGERFFVAGLRMCPTRGVAPLLPRYGTPQGSPRLVQGRRWVVGAWKISASTTEDGVYLVRFFDDPGPIKLALSPAGYTTSAGAVRGSWCLQIHVASAFSPRVQRNVDDSRGAVVIS